MGDSWTPSSAVTREKEKGEVVRPSSLLLEERVPVPGGPDVKETRTTKDRRLESHVTTDFVVA